ncbi:MULTISPECIES: S1C family serine protease [unclassified Butyrivibrio]|uniref:S1C family serine protease n=1 Tax=unclassified Butyrivibrio TaxID=2639466 RepID=UPI0003B5AA7D|nr:MULTISPECIES: S1C family serine protease [unclassified Butyrivibrio]SEL60778.1 serine protease Do [Butyrivibrio sp. ob235]
MEDNRENVDDVKLDPEKSPIARADFLREKIKQRPINKKKLLRRTLITMTLAVVFGAVACLTFVFLAPVINNRLYPEETPTPVALTEETVADEMQPEDMYADDNAIAAEAASVAIDMASSELSKMKSEMTSHQADQTDYMDMYASLKSVATSAEKSLVTVTSKTSDTNWINDPYESEGQTCGVIVADNGAEYLILVQTSAISDAESIQVTFCDETVGSAYLKQSDAVTGLGIVAVKYKDISENTRAAIGVAPLGSSKTGGVIGTPVIAVGRPMGTRGSMCYGFVTSANSDLDLADSNYKLLTTDMNGSTNASGAIINLSGSVVGFIDMKYNTQAMPNVLSAVGITELRALIEDLSNGKGRTFVGIHGQTVPKDLQEGENIPAGAYVIRTEMDSPAMLSGVQSGDIITAVNGEEVAGFDTFVSRIRDVKPGTQVTLTLMRQAAEGYAELTIDISSDNSTDNAE